MLFHYGLRIIIITGKIHRRNNNVSGNNAGRQQKPEFGVSSSDTSVATVDQNGNVTAKGAGTAVITAKLTMNGEKAACRVNVEYYCQAEDSYYSDWDKHADLHNLELVTPSYGFPYYVCRGCGNKRRYYSNV